MNKQKTNEGMKWWGYLICLVIIVAAIFMLLDMIKTWKITSLFTCGRQLKDGEQFTPAKDLSGGRKYEPLDFIIDTSANKN